ncbi:MAG TPA: hypothetical protein VHF28_07540 [Nitrososphaera sp.]|jgi:hypothetical protein|nr:hypothetical protein [Nitrososphaera sp.]
MAEVELKINQKEYTNLMIEDSEFLAMESTKRYNHRMQRVLFLFVREQEDLL